MMRPDEYVTCMLLAYGAGHSLRAMTEDPERHTFTYWVNYPDSLPVGWRVEQTPEGTWRESLAEDPPLLIYEAPTLEELCQAVCEMVG